MIKSFNINKNKILMVILSVFSLSTTSCDSLYRLLDEEGAQEKEIVGEIYPYESNLTVKEVQQLLKIYGYDCGAIDGNLGIRTRNAIERFQKDLGLNITRFVDDATWEKLTVFKRNNFIVNEELNIALIQQVLRAAGCDPGEIDGKLGAKTIAAVKKFQQKMDIKVDGKIGYQTLSKMRLFLPEKAVNDI